MPQVTAKGLNEEKAELLAKARKINDERKKPDGTLSAEDQIQFDRIMAEVKVLGDAANGILGLEKTEPVFDDKREGVKLIDEQGNICRGLTASESFAEAIGDHARHHGESRESTGANLVKDGLRVGDFLRAMAIGPRNAVEKAGLSGGGSGGYTVPQMLSSQMIDRFRARMVMTKLGALTVPLTGSAGSFTYAKVLTDPVPTWRHETTEVDESGPTFGAISFVPRSLTVIARASREVLQDSPIRV